MSTTDKYPYLPAKWVLFHQPSGGYLKEHDRAAPQLRGQIWDLTDLAIKALALCDGTRTVAQILGEIAATCEADDFAPARSVGEFLADALTKGIIALQDQKKRWPIREKGSKDKYYPMHFAIELTDACNLSCKHCYRKSGPHLSRFIPAQSLLDLLEEFYLNGVHSLELSGGEPTLHPDIDHILSFALNWFGAVALLTNGTLMTESICDVLTQYRHRAIVQIDLDGGTAHEHEGLRGVTGSFDKAVAAVRELSRRDIRVRVAMSIYPGNVSTIKQTYHLAKDLGATWFVASPVMDIGRAGQEMLLTWDELKAAMELINTLSRKDPDTVLTAAELKKLSGESESNCGAGSRSIAIGPDGNLRPCFLVNRPSPAFPNILEVPVDVALETFPQQYFRELEPPGLHLCGDCEFAVFCFGCTARPIIARERLRQKNEAFTCRWDQATGFSKELKINL
ncbi:MAG: radical SAM protein [Proteobacteria bacterium]|nr:radical SAM protein [Pseudomonadota bacterium]